MASNKREILIQSILGGQGQMTHFSQEDQFLASLAIDPARRLESGATLPGTLGLIRPIATEKASGTVIQNAPMWIVPNIKNAVGFQHIFVYDALGSAYYIDASAGNAVTALSDGGSLSNSGGNGCAYYDNYIYFAKNTTIARYGPLNGTATFNGDYWSGTLGKTALENQTYPSESTSSIPYPNHVLHRHSDGSLYVADTVGNRGFIHQIKTKKTTVEGDTDDSSVYQKLGFGYGLWPTAIESYGTSLAVALYEGGLAANQGRGIAKLAFWDTSSQNFNQITLDEFPDEIITAMKNINGVLYIISGSMNTSGFRVCQYVGGNSFKEIVKFDDGKPPFAGGMDGNSTRLLFGSNCTIPESGNCVYSLGLEKGSFGFGLFNIMRVGQGQGQIVTSLKLARSGYQYSELPLVGWGYAINVSGGTANGIDQAGTDYSNNPANWWSQIYKIGKPFKITKIRIPLAQGVSSNMIVTPKIYTDDGNGTSYTGGVSAGMSVINSTNYSGKRSIVMRPQNLVGTNNFWLELRWTGSALCTVGLPITIEYEILDD